jgi:hypothetical protein
MQWYRSVSQMYQLVLYLLDTLAPFDCDFLYYKSCCLKTFKEVPSCGVVALLLKVRVFC